MKIHGRQSWREVAIATLAVAGWLCVPSFAQTQWPDSQPETVHIIFHVQKGHEDEMKKVLAEAWQAYKQGDMVVPNFHVVLQGSEDGKPYFVEILTWRDHDIPDHMPPQVQAIWKRMNAICEKRGDKPPIDGGEVQLIVPRL